MKIKNFLLGIAIFILTISTTIFGIYTFYGKPPHYDNFCYTGKIADTKENCENMGGKWTMTYPIEKIDNQLATPTKDNYYCDLSEYYLNCDKEFKNSQIKYNSKVFIITLPIGIIVIILGALIFGLETVGAGLMAGGVGVILYGVIGFWKFAEDYIKFIITLIALIIIIFLAYYLNKKYFKKK
ncbi:MAG: hypothetical protein QXW97_04415 [Candidatus Pacearchaeota archaeon]